MTKKLVSCILVVCMLLTMLPTMAWATEPVVASGTDLDDPVASGTDLPKGTLDISDGSILITDTGYAQGIHKHSNAKGYYIVDSENADVTETPYTGEITITNSNTATSADNGYVIIVEGNGQTITLNGVTIDNTSAASNLPAFVLLSGNATLNLEGTNILKGANCAPAVQINKAATLTINGDGILDAVGNNQTPAIGAARSGDFAINPDTNKKDNDYRSGGNLIIESGIINVTGTAYVPAIGGSNAALFGDITINGGSVTASGNGGIATSTTQDTTQKGYGGDITINGGKIIAKCTAGGEYWAAIGGGNGSTKVGTRDVTINGGEIFLDVSGNSNAKACAIRTDCNFKMTGGTLVEVNKRNNNTVTDQIVANTVSITGGNVKEYYSGDVANRELTSLVFADGAAGKDVLVSEVNGEFTDTSKYWSAKVSDDNTITTYLATGTQTVYAKIDGQVKSAAPVYGIVNFGTACTCEGTSGTITWSEESAELADVTLSKDMANIVKDKITASFAEADSCPAVLHPGYEKVTVSMTVKDAEGTPVTTNVDTYATYADGKLTLKKPADVAKYTVTLTAKTQNGEVSSEKSLTVTIDNANAVGAIKWSGTFEEELTLYKDMKESKARSISAKYEADGTVADDYTVTVTMTVKDAEGIEITEGADAYATYAGGKVTLKKPDGVKAYTVTLTAKNTAGMSETKSMKVTIDNDKCAGGLAWNATLENVTLYGGISSTTRKISASYDVAEVINPDYAASVTMTVKDANGTEITEGVDAYATYVGGVLTLKRQDAVYTVLLTAANTAGDKSVQTIMVKASTDTAIDLANGPVTVTAGANGTVVYKQDGQADKTVDAATPMTITGGHSFVTGNAIKIENCSPTIVLQDVVIEGSTNQARSNILIAGDETDHTKLILSGTNTLIRAANAVREYCAIEVRGATLTIDCEEGATCKDKACDDKLIIETYNGTLGAGIGSRMGWRLKGDEGGEPEGFTVNIDGGYYDITVGNYGAAIGSSWISGNEVTNEYTITINDGYINADAPSNGVAIGAGRSNGIPKTSSVTINGGMIEATSNGNGTSSAINAADLVVAGDADVTVKGNIAANSVELKDNATLDMQEKVDCTEGNPGGNISNGYVWEGKVTLGTTDVKVSGNAKLATAGGINGSLTTSGNATAEINGVSPAGGDQDVSTSVGGVSGTVTVGEGSKVTVTEEIKGEVTVEGGATINGTTLPEDAGTVTVPADKLDDVTVDANGTVTLPAGSTVTKDGETTTLTQGGTVDKDGTVTDPTKPVTPPPAGDGDDPTPPSSGDEGDKPTPQPPYGGYYPSYTPSVTPAAPSVDSSSLNNAALAVGSAIKDGSAEFTPVNGYTKDEVVKLQKDGKLRMGIEKTVGYGSVAEKNLAEAAIKSAGGAVNGTSVMYFDITPVLKLDNGTVVAHVTDTEKAITITIELSDELTKAAKDGKDIAVVRVHDGKAEFLSAKLNAAKTKVTFSSADFSTYAVVALNKATSAKTFDAGVAMYVGMAVLAATGSAVVIGKKRK